MSEQTILAESSTATPVMEVERGPLVNLTSDERAEFRRTGELPEPPKKDEEPAPSITEHAGEAESPKKTQEKSDKGRAPGAEKRIGEVISENKRLKAELEDLKKPKAEAPKTETAPPPKVEPPQAGRKKPTAEDKDKDGKPRYSTYEDFVEDLADWKAEQRWSNSQREQAAQQQTREFQSKVEEARGRYKDFDEVIKPAVAAIHGDQQISPAVKAMLNDSEVLSDLLYTIGSDAKELAAFTKMAKTEPGKALRYIALTESLIREELESGKGEKKPAAKPPEKQKTAAPAPPSEVGGRAAAPGDELQDAAKANDFRKFKSVANRQALARLRG